ncbi:MAG: diguanylate cyclase [Planctomycetaceae bacterium]
MTGSDTAANMTAAAMPPRQIHPMDSSGLLLALLDLANDSAKASAQYEDQYVEWAAPPSTLRRLVSALVYRDETTMLHCRRVALLAVGMAKYLGWDEAAVGKLEVAALLHDIGKLGIPDHILHKPGRLSPQEQEFVLLHHYIGVDLLQACRIDREIVEIVWSAHTHGRGQADDRSSNRGCVSQGSRLLAVADAYDSLRNDQSYRKGKSHDETMRLLTEHSGKEYDRNIVSTLNRWIREEGQSFLAEEAGRRISDTLAGAVDAETIRQAGELSHVFSFLYLMESLYDGFCLVDSGQRFVVWNHGMERVTGIGALQIMGESWERRLLAFQDEKKQPVRDRDCPLQRSLLSGVTHCQTLQVEHRRQGKWREVEVQAIPLVDQEGKTHGAALLMRDTAGQKDTSGQYRELAMAARRDPLTGVGNRGEMEGKLARMFLARNQKQTEHPFSVIFLDLDHFKSINDTHGHAIGDRVLVNLARLLGDELYSGEIVCRYGGEEFVILCPETDLASAIQRAERLRSAVTATELAAPLQLGVSSSFGVAQVEDGDSVEVLLHRADEALYEAKRGGRNRTCYKSKGGASSSAQPASAAAVPSKPARPMAHQVEFETRVAADMVIHKLGGFINETKADLQKVEPNYVDMRIGRANLFGGWGKTLDKQPVRVELNISDAHQNGRWGSDMVTIKVLVTPIGKVKQRDVFDHRAGKLTRDLLSYFAVTQSLANY